ncbi:hypothetical protein BJX61DRAFT_545999 [Aspergillus egyptiacus]|nr:hypothetical protein BJX61DRAFT_545999 [Aspergillus egyptiacus]
MQHTKEKTRRYFPRPSWRRPRPAVLDEKDAWIQEKGRAHHPAFAAQSEFDLNENRYITYEEKATRHLEQLLRSHDAEMPDEPKVYECSWEVVFQALSQAKSAYVAGSHFGRRAGMGMDLTLGAVQALPDEFGLGAIKGVLALIFQSVNRGIENRDKILDAFDSIPETIVTIHVGCQCLKPTEGDLQLKSEFYSALINGLPFLIDVLLGKQPWYQKVRRFMLEHIVRRSSEQTPVFRVLITFAHHSLLLQRVISPHVSRYVCLSAGRADPIPTQLR